MLGAVLPTGLPNRRSIRLREYDYAAAGPYFVTLCAYRGHCIFGRFVNGRVVIDPIGQTIQSCWEQIPLHFPNITLDVFVIMPNHVHGIIMIHKPGTAVPCPYGGEDGAKRGTACRGPRLDSVPFPPIVREGNTQERFSSPVVGSLPTILRSFKSAVTKRVHENPHFCDTRVWQRGYYEHIIRTMRSLEETRRYIAENPSLWPEDPKHPVFVNR
jgi:REP element-mobilizing transposase RayT